MQDDSQRDMFQVARPEVYLTASPDCFVVCMHHVHCMHLFE